MNRDDPVHDLTRPAADPAHWTLDPQVAFLNHGSFGACPRAVLEFQRAVRERMEREPVRFFVRDLEGLADDARASLAAFIGCDPGDLVFVPNATTGVNVILRSLQFGAGDELLTTNHDYNACRNALRFVADRAGARVVVAEIPFPIRGEDEIVEAVLSCVTARTKLALLDHVTSATGLVLPIRRLVGELAARGVETLVDGAHAPGMVPLDLKQLGAAYYTGNCHKWLCAPKGAAFLVVRRDLQAGIRPLTISHGANSSRTDRSRFLIEFGWMGTADPSAMLSVPEAIRYIGGLLQGGWPEVMQRNRELVLAGRCVLCRALKIETPCADGLVGSMASVPFLDSQDAEPSKSPLYLDPLQDWLLGKKGLEVPILPWPAHPRRVIRISAQLYNSLGQYEQLAEAIKAMPGMVRGT